MAEDGFEWFQNSDVVVETQMAIAVYESVQGKVCILQQGDYQTEDNCIIIAKDRARAVAMAILRVAGDAIPEQQDERPAAQQAPKDPTAAERQRRYRDKRNGRDSYENSRVVTRDADGAGGEVKGLDLGSAHANDAGR